MARKSLSDLAVVLLAVGVSRHFAWEIADAESRGWVSKGLGGLAMLCLLVAVVLAYRSVDVTLVAAWWAAHEVQVVACSFGYLWSPWQVAPGQAICSALVGVDLGAFGIFAAAVLAFWLAARLYRSTTVRG